MEEANIEIFFETSAKTAQNVKKMFDEVCSQLLLKSLKKTGKDGETNGGDKLKLGNPDDKANSSADCC